MKKSISVISAAVIAASMAVSVSAADYSSNPNYSLPPAKPSVSVNNNSGNEAKPGTALSNPYEVMSKKDIAVAVAKGEPVYASYETAQLKANAVAMLAGKDGGTLTVVTKRYTAVIDGDSVTDAKDISLAVKMTKSTEQGAMILRTAQQGEFGCTVELHISAKYYSQCEIDLGSAHVYYVDENKNVTDMGAVEFDNDGNIVVTMTAGGKFIIM